MISLRLPFNLLSVSSLCCQISWHALPLTHTSASFFLESKLLKPTTEECQRGLTSALNCKEEQCDMFRMAGFEGVLKPFFICLKSLSHSEVSHSIKWCTGTQAPAMPWPPHNDINPSFNLRIFFQRKTSILFCSSSREMIPLGDLKQGCSGAQSRHLNENSTVRV